jgi:hypothetical protein
VHERVLTVGGSVEAVAKASQLKHMLNLALTRCGFCFRRTTS